MRFDLLNLLRERGNVGREPPRCHDHRHSIARPLSLDPPHYAVSRIGRAVENAGTDTVFRPLPDHVLRWHELGGGQFGRLPSEIFGCRLNARSDHASKKLSTPGNTVKRGGGPEVYDDRIAAVQFGGTIVSRPYSSAAARVFTTRSAPTLMGSSTSSVIGKADSGPIANDDVPTAF